MPQHVVIYTQGGREVAREVFESDVDRLTVEKYQPVSTFAELFELDCEGEVFVVVSPSGVAHRSPFVVMRTLCGVDYPRSWKPASGLVTCTRCIAASR